MLEKLCVKCKKAFADIPFFHGEGDNLTVSQQQLHLSIKYSKCFTRAIADICSYKGDFGVLSLALIFFRGTVKFCKGNIFSSKRYLQSSVLKSGMSFCLKRGVGGGGGVEHPFF